ncbi:MAG: YgfZ/GcvT domain-containing protein [Arachnia sp.]
MTLLAEGPDAGLVWHHGSPTAESRAVTDGSAVADLSNRDVLEIAGPDRLEWLHSLSTQHLSKLAAGAPVSALFLSPTGHIEHVIYGVDDGERLLAWTEPGHGPALAQWLRRMQFMMRVEVSLRDDLRVVWAGKQIPVPQATPARASELGGLELFWPREAPVPAGVPVGTWSLEAARIAAGIPRIFIDTDLKTIPNEIGLVGTHLDKGCYRGQETVARVHTLGRPPRRLVMLHLDGSADALPAQGSPLIDGERTVGFVGSSARHHELGPIALGLVKRNVDPAATLSADSILANQEVLVDPDVGLHVRPRLR